MTRPCSKLRLLLALVAGAAGVGVGAAGTKAAEQTASRPARLTLERPFRILVERKDAEGSRSVTVFSEGFGFWQNETQFPLPTTALDTITGALADARFQSMPDVLGDGKRRLRGRVSVVSPSLNKEVIQLLTGEQSQAFDRLTAAIADACEPLASDGIRPKDLADGLSKVASGELAPAALGLVVQRQPELAHPQGSGWLLNVEYGAGTLQESVDRRRSEPRRLALSPESVRRLALQLRDSGIAAWPVNLYSTEYVQIIVSVLQWRHVVEARAFARLTPTTHPQEQKKLEGLLAGLESWRREAAAPAGHP